MKFSQYNLTTDQYGYEFAKNNVMKTSKECGCMMCGQPTHFIEVLSESYLCSDECVTAFLKMYNDTILNKENK